MSEWGCRLRSVPQGRKTANPVPPPPSTGRGNSLTRPPPLVAWTCEPALRSVSYSSQGDFAVKRWLLPALIVVMVPLLVRGQAPDEKKLDAIVAQALKAFDAPGAA